MQVHTYPAQLRWSGSTGLGYAQYSRAHTVEVAGESHSMSSDPHFGGDPLLRNPEQLLVMAASSVNCCRSSRSRPGPGSMWSATSTTRWQR